MAHIVKRTTLEDVKLAEPDTIWYSVNTCWWTHRQSDLRQHTSGLPCDPRGGMLMMAGADSFFDVAEGNPGHYGEHGLDALIAAHNDNCVVAPDDLRSTCLRTWPEYNEALDG